MRYDYASDEILSGMDVEGFFEPHSVRAGIPFNVIIPILILLIAAAICTAVFIVTRKKLSSDSEVKRSAAFPVGAVFLIISAAFFMLAFIVVMFSSAAYSFEMDIALFLAAICQLVPILCGKLILSDRTDRVEGNLSSAFLWWTVYETVALLAKVVIFGRDFDVLPVGSIFNIIPLVYMLIMSRCMVYDPYKDRERIAVMLSKFWPIAAFLPAVGFLPAVSLYTSYDRPPMVMLLAFIPFILYSLAISFIAYWMFTRVNFGPRDPSVKANEQMHTAKVRIYGYRGLVKHIILLSILPFIWQFIWTYKTTKFLNRTPGVRRRSPVAKLLLCIFIPFYSYYWIYQSAKRIDIMARSNGIYSDIRTLSLFLSIFAGVFAPIVMQAKINEICITCTLPKRSTVSDDEATASLRRYKSLLDDGVISEEDFEFKKRQLLQMEA